MHNSGATDHCRESMMNSLDCSFSSGSSQVPSRRSRTNDKGDREVGESPPPAPQRTLQSGDASIGDFRR